MSTNVKTNVKTEAKVEKKIVTLKACKVIGVSSPSTIMQIAADRKVAPQDVFVRVRVAYNGKEFSVSNKLRYLGQSGYEKMQALTKSGEPVDLSVDLNSGFFRIEEQVAVADLFKSTETTKRDYSLADLLGV